MKCKQLYVLYVFHKYNYIELLRENYLHIFSHVSIFKTIVVYRHILNVYQ